MKISTTININCTPEEVFHWINEPNKAMFWQKGVKRREIIKETTENRTIKLIFSPPLTRR